MTSDDEPLADENAALRATFLEHLPPARCEAINRHLAALDERPVGAVGVGEVAPPFELRNIHGYRVALSEQLAAGPVVITFYRGGWCSFCHRQLRALQRRLPQIEALGARLLAISPEASKHASRLAERYHLAYEILVDAGSRVARMYGLLQPGDPQLADFDERYSVELSARNADGDSEVPIPATYVVSASGEIAAAHVSPDWTRRMEPDAVVDALRGLKGDRSDPA